MTALSGDVRVEFVKAPVILNINTEQRSAIKAKNCFIADACKANIHTQG